MKTANCILSEKNRETIWVSPETTIYETLKLMNTNKIGAILIKEQDKVVGIWTERDLMHNVALDGFNPKTEKISDHMTKDLFSVKHDSDIYELLDHFLGRRLRHILIEKDGTFLGLLSTGDVIKACLQDKDHKIKDLNKIASCNYHEDWKWKPK